LLQEHHSHQHQHHHYCYQLCIYDALYIRYNATQANILLQQQQSSSSSSSSKQYGILVGGAGQPLHRDLGLVSVNIMLNDDANGDFQGGGTFFENQLLSLLVQNRVALLSSSSSHVPTPPPPLKPISVGHCLAHYSSERHAGAATYTGVRDIMVLFITAKCTSGSKADFNGRAPPPPPPPALIRNALLKQCRADCCNLDVDGISSSSSSSKKEMHADERRVQQEDSILCRISHQRLASLAVPTDGEAYQYLGMACLEYSNFLLSLQQQQQQENEQSTAKNVDKVGLVLQAAVDSLEFAAQWTPCDARVYNNLGIALTRQS
jgi:hypothetical protein